MPVSFNTISNSPIFSQVLSSNQVGRLKEHSVRALNFINQSLQNEKIAPFAVIGTNLIFFELTNRVATFITNFLLRNRYAEGNFAIGIYVSLNALSLTALNLALYRGLGFALSPLNYTLVSITAIVARSIYQFC